MKTLSVTKMSTYQDCPRKYWYSYVMKILTPKSEGFYFGSAIHAGLENYYNKKEKRILAQQKVCSRPYFAGEIYVEPIS